jgi:hypothetical protein
MKGVGCLMLGLVALLCCGVFADTTGQDTSMQGMGDPDSTPSGCFPQISKAWQRYRTQCYIA